MEFGVHVYHQARSKISNKASHLCDPLCIIKYNSYFEAIL